MTTSDQEIDRAVATVLRNQAEVFFDMIEIQVRSMLEDDANHTKTQDRIRVRLAYMDDDRVDFVEVTRNTPGYGNYYRLKEKGRIHFFGTSMEKAMLLVTENWEAWIKIGSFIIALVGVGALALLAKVPDAIAQILYEIMKSVIVK